MTGTAEAEGEEVGVGVSAGAGAPAGPGVADPLPGPGGEFCCWSNLGYLSEGHAQFVWPSVTPRAPPKRRPTTLRLDGELLTVTESHSQFSTPPPTRRPPLARRATALPRALALDFLGADPGQDGAGHVPGSETHDSFVAASARRSEFIRRPTNLTLQLRDHHMPADSWCTEQKDNFVELDLRAEPPARERLVKRPTNLRLEGELEINPEYTERFTQPPPQRPPQPVRPRDRLRFDLMEAAAPPGPPRTTGPPDPLPPCQSESHAQFTGYGGKAGRRPTARRHPTNLKMEGEITGVPEYRDAYVEVRAERPPLIRPRPNLSPSGGDMFLETEKSAKFVEFSAGKRQPIKRHATNMKMEGELVAIPEYRTAFKEYDNVRAVIRKPEPHVTLGGTMSLPPCSTCPAEEVLRRRAAEQVAVEAPPAPPPGPEPQVTTGSKPDSTQTPDAKPYSEYKDWYLDFPREIPLSQVPQRDTAPRFDQCLPSPGRKCPEPNFQVDVHRTPKRIPRPRIESSGGGGGGGGGGYCASFMEYPRTPSRRIVKFDSQKALASRRGSRMDIHGPVEFEPLDHKAFVVHPKDELKFNRREFSPRQRRRQRRVTYDVEQDTTEDTDLGDAEGDDSAFQILDARVSERPGDADNVVERVTSLHLDEDQLRSPSEAQGYGSYAAYGPPGSVPTLAVSGDPSGAASGRGNLPDNGGPHDAPNQGPGQGPGQPAGDPGYCAAPVYLTTAPYYCTGASPPHHLYFGGFCPNWSPSQYCPSLAPTAAPPAPSPSPSPAPSTPASQPNYCPSILPPVHPYVVGCCPPPAIIIPPAAATIDPNANVVVNPTTSTTTSPSPQAPPATSSSTAATTAAPAGKATTTQGKKPNPKTVATSSSEDPPTDSPAPAPLAPTPAPRAFVVLEQTRNANNVSSDSNNNNVSVDKPPTPPGPSSGYE